MPQDEHSFQAKLGLLLRTGVLLSAAIVAIAGVWYLIRHGTEPINYFQFHPSAPEPLSGILKGVLNGHSRNLIQVGLVVLVATPIARVILSLVQFLRERDYVYILVTMLVLAVLVASILTP